jgi:hypothetical protein
MQNFWDGINNVPELKRYKNLEAKVKDIMMDVLESCRKPTHQMIRDRIKGEISFINIRHPKFNTDMNYQVEELNECYPEGHPERKIAEIAPHKRARAMSFYGGPGDFIKSS